MTSAISEDVKEIVFVNKAAQKAFDALPAEILERAEAALSVLQNGGTLRKGEYEDLNGKNLSGASEIKMPWNGDEYRVYQVAIYDEAIFILDAGMKKSPRGSKIPQEQVERLEKRLALAKIAYSDGKIDFKERFKQRKSNRGEPDEPEADGLGM